MTTIAGHARSLVAYHIWADGRIFEAASKLDDGQFAALRDQFAHMLGTMRWWYARWTGGQYEGPRITAFEDAQAKFAEAHAAFADFAESLDDAGWHRSAQWWKDFGYDAAAPVGEMLTQVVLHGVQHRSEVAVTLTSDGSSPGDLDYLQFLAQRRGIER